MPWPIPQFVPVEYPKPLSIRNWVPTLLAIATVVAGAVLLLWQNGTPTNTLRFWYSLVGAPLVVCALVFGLRLDSWEDDQTDAEEVDREQQRLTDMWRDWTRRRLCIIDVAAFPAATDEIDSFADAKVDLRLNWDRTIAFEWAKGRSNASRRIRLLYRVATRFADSLRTRREVVLTLMLDHASLEQNEAWAKRTMRIFGGIVPGVIFRVEVHPATGGAQWITQQVDRIDTVTRLVITAQIWMNEEEEHTFSEGAAAFLVEPLATETGSIYRPMTSASDTLKVGLAQIMQMQVLPERLAHVWFAGCSEDESSTIRSMPTETPSAPPTECLLDGFLGNSGPASGWIALAIAMEAMRGAGPQLVVWREPESESLHLCTISPLPQKETTV